VLVVVLQGCNIGAVNLEGRCDIDKGGHATSMS